MAIVRRSVNKSTPLHKTTDYLQLYHVGCYTNADKVKILSTLKLIVY